MRVIRRDAISTAGHSSPSNLYLGEALAALEGTEYANVTASGMGAISSVILELCQAGDHIISSRTIYGGTYAFLKNFVKKFDIDTSFVDITNLEAVALSITSNTKMIYCESLSNPLLEIADIRALAKIAKKNGIPLVVDNTFSPLSIAPAKLGADIVVHSLTKFINGTSDCVAVPYVDPRSSVCHSRMCKQEQECCWGAPWIVSGQLRS